MQTLMEVEDRNLFTDTQELDWNALGQAWKERKPAHFWATEPMGAAFFAQLDAVHPASPGASESAPAPGGGARRGGALQGRGVAGRAGANASSTTPSWRCEDALLPGDGLCSWFCSSGRCWA